MDFSAFEAVQGLVVASLFLGQEVRPVVLLDGDDAGASTTRRADERAVCRLREGRSDAE